MTHHEQTPPSDAATPVLDLLQQLIRAHYDHAARQPDANGEVHEAVADVLVRAHPHSTSGVVDGTTLSDVAARVESALTNALRSLTPTTPEYNAIDLVRRQVRSMRPQA